MEINRDKYLKKLIGKEQNERIKVITGLRRVGKSYLLNTLFKNHLLNRGVDSSQIVSFAFDNMEDLMKLDKYLPKEKTLIYDARGNYTVNSKKFCLYIKDQTPNDQLYYLMLDEIQLLDNFVPVLNGFLSHSNYDIYVTGSNSKMLSKDVLTAFRGRGDQIMVLPLTFKEFFNASNLSFDEAYLEYQYYGGMPYVSCINGNEEEKQSYLKKLFTEIYYKDIEDRNGIIETDSVERLMGVLASSIGSYTNPANLENTFRSELHITYNHETIKKHIEFIKDAYLINEAKRYDVKGKKYIGSNSKYYFTDIGLRNALINFRQNEPTHIMENIIYNELISKGYSVDVGIVAINEKNENGNYVSKQLETDFVCNKMSERIYIQSAYSMETMEKLKQEERSLANINDGFRKVIITKDSIKSYRTENGTEVISLKEWLLKEGV